MRLFHHLIAPSLIAEPFACAPDLGTAAQFIAEEMKGEGVVTLSIRSICGPCPVCEPEEHAAWEHRRKMRNCAEVTGGEDLSRLYVRADRFGVVGEITLPHHFTKLNGVSKH
jgi:hypothetical protein